MSFTELLLTPKWKTNNVMKPAINSLVVILAKELFVNKKYLKNADNIRINKNYDNTNRGIKKRLLLRLVIKD